jgi:dihydrofolate reductase
MRRVVYYAAMSLDGFIAEGDDTLEWLMKFPGVEPGAAVQTVPGGYDEFYADVGALVMGSVTYEFVLDEASTWAYAGKPTWVLTTRDLPVFEGADDLRFTNAAVTDLYDEMVAAAGDRKLWVVGGGNVASQFADAGLIDEVWVTVVPVVLGSGKPLFDRRVPGPPMRPTEVLPRASGMIELRFEVVR